jgi:hypothetical protein
MIGMVEVTQAHEEAPTLGEKIAQESLNGVT